MTKQEVKKFIIESITSLFEQKINMSRCCCCKYLQYELELNIKTNSSRGIALDIQPINFWGTSGSSYHRLEIFYSSEDKPRIHVTQYIGDNGGDEIDIDRWFVLAFNEFGVAGLYSSFNTLLIELL